MIRFTIDNGEEYYETYERTKLLIERMVGFNRLNPHWTSELSEDFNRFEIKKDGIPVFSVVDYTGLKSEGLSHSYNTLLIYEDIVKRGIKKTEAKGTQYVVGFMEAYKALMNGEDVYCIANGKGYELCNKNGHHGLAIHSDISTMYKDLVFNQEEIESEWIIV